MAETEFRRCDGLFCLPQGVMSKMAQTAHDDLYSFGQLLKYDAFRTISILNEIDDVVYASKVFCDRIDFFAKYADELGEKVNAKQKQVDEDGALAEKLNSGLKLFEDIYAQLKSMRSELDKSAHSSAEDVCEAVDLALQSLSHVHESVSILVSLIREHDADFDQVLPEEYLCAEDLIAALRS
ncbi:hypothetical protein ACQUFY_21005 [Robbsia andropogonis]|uniref:hypothetical protein n=1 Tax=Robbsia andropogonis TaxID=28092 RepID=UPI003D1AE8AF